MTGWRGPGTLGACPRLPLFLFLGCGELCRVGLSRRIFWLDTLTKEECNVVKHSMGSLKRKEMYIRYG
jgi:hypothetical protein